MGFVGRGRRYEQKAGKKGDKVLAIQCKYRADLSNMKVLYTSNHSGMSRAVDFIMLAHHGKRSNSAENLKTHVIAERQYDIDLIAKIVGAKDENCSPSGLAEFLLMLFAPKCRAEYMVDDQREQFARKCREFGRDYAVRWYWRDTLHSIWPQLRRAIGRTLKWGVVIAAMKRLAGL
jgi:hypothetical protein